MSLKYGTLKTRVLTIASRASGMALTSDVDDAVREAEGLIARELRCAEMLTRVALDEADRSDEGIYTLPSDFLELRSAWVTSTNGDVQLTNEPLSTLRLRSGSNPVRAFSVLSDAEIEFRGVPETDAEIELLYFARPAAFSDDADVNDILTKHEAIYVYGALASIHTQEQDYDAAQTCAVIAQDAIDRLNEQAGRMIGGQRTAGGYNFCRGRAY